MGKKFSRKRRTLICSALFTSLFWGLLAQLDPLGFKTASDQQSESVFMRLISGPAYRSKAQDEITVVLIDDHYLRQLGASWPLSYVDQDLLLSDILALKPKMVFLDFLYQHKHSDEIKQFTETIKQNLQGKSETDPIPIFIPYLVKDEQGVDSCIASGNEEDRVTAASLVKKDSVMQEMQESGARKTYVGWTGCENRYPAYILGDSKFTTPAFALFEEFCQQPGAENFTSCTDLKNNPVDFEAPMVVRWGTHASDEHESALQKANIDCNEGTSQFDQFIHVARQIFQVSTKKGKAERCTYTDTVHATWFLGSSERLRKYQKDMIEDRIVLLGTQVEGVHDWVVSPTNGKVPGVYLLSMALDNYLEYGSYYFKEMSFLASVITEVLVLFLITLISGLGWLTYTRWRRKQFRNQQKQIKKKYRSKVYIPTMLNKFSSVFLFKLVLPIGMALLVAWIMWSKKYAPMDWIGISILSFIANPVKITDCQNGTECGSPDDSWPFKPCKLFSRKFWSRYK